LTDILPGGQVCVWSVANGQRIETRSNRFLRFLELEKGVEETLTDHRSDGSSQFSLCLPDAPTKPNSHLRGEAHSYLRIMVPIGVLIDNCAVARPTCGT
jgi:hypothetical protein